MNWTNMNTKYTRIEKIKILGALPDAMRLRGWIKYGTTDDRRTLTEIKRELLAAGASEVAFSRGALDDVHYWANTGISK